MEHLKVVDVKESATKKGWYALLKDEEGKKVYAIFANPQFQEEKDRLKTLYNIRYFLNTIGYDSEGIVSFTPNDLIGLEGDFTVTSREHKNISGSYGVIREIEIPPFESKITPKFKLEQ